MNKPRHYHIWTIGCQMNEADSRYLSQQLEFAGYQHAQDAEDADLVVLNTCVVRQQAENKAYGKLGSVQTMKEKNPNMIIGLMGCMVGMREAPALAKRFPFVDVFMPPSETAPLLEHLESKGLLDHLKKREEDERELREAIQDETLPLPKIEQGNSVTAHVPIVLGCSHACTFCVIPYRRGAERSRPMQDILDEVTSLAGQGIVEVMLLGQIVDRYGMDFDDDTDLSLLLRKTSEIEGIKRVRFLTSHPNYMTDKLLETVAAIDKISPQIEVPIQAGNDEVLRNMRRGYTNQQYRDLVAKIRRIIPDAAIHTDIIVGFPGETEEQFMDTVQLVKDLEMDKTHLAMYSQRPKTIAARQMKDDIPFVEKKRRWTIIDQLNREILDKKNKELRGKTLEVLVENRYKDRWYGRTPQAKPVFFEDDRELTGQLIDVHIDWTGPFSLVGRAADVVNQTREPAVFSV